MNTGHGDRDAHVATDELHLVLAPGSTQPRPGAAGRQGGQASPARHSSPDAAGRPPATARQELPLGHPRSGLRLASREPSRPAGPWAVGASSTPTLQTKGPRHRGEATYKGHSCHQGSLNRKPGVPTPTVPLLPRSPPAGFAPAQQRAPACRDSHGDTLHATPEGVPGPNPPACGVPSLRGPWPALQPLPTVEDPPRSPRPTPPLPRPHRWSEGRRRLSRPAGRPAGGRGCAAGRARAAGPGSCRSPGTGCQCPRCRRAGCCREAQASHSSRGAHATSPRCHPAV